MEQVREAGHEVTAPARAETVRCVDISRERGIERRIPRGSCPGKGIRRRHHLARTKRRTLVT